jgi:antitoxin component YwqK of YwqJK toxin-antitoxin module
MILNHNFFLQQLLKLIIPVILLMFISACGNEPAKAEKIIGLHPDSLIYDETGKPFNGIIKDKLGNRTIEFEVVDGKKYGMFRAYFPNEQLEMEGEIINNKNEGTWKYYYPNGQLESEGKFVNDRADGEWNWYYPSGIKRETGRIYFR